jgi:hypothetical protein
MPKKNILSKSKVKTEGGDYPQFQQPYYDTPNGMLTHPYDMPGMYGAPGMQPGMQQPAQQDSKLNLPINNIDNSTPKNWYERIQKIMMFLGDWMATSTALATQNTVSVAKFINENPVIEINKVEEKKVPNGPVIPGGPPSNMITKTVKTTEHKALPQITLQYKIFLIIALMFLMFVIPWVIYLLTLIYTYPFWTLKYFLDKTTFLKDKYDFGELKRIYNIGGWYVNDYILYMLIVVGVYILFSIIVFTTNYVYNKKKELMYATIRTSILIGIIAIILCLHIAFHYENLQELGTKRDNLIITIKKSLNYDYIYWLSGLDQLSDENCKKCYENGNKLTINTQSDVDCSMCVKQNIIKKNSLSSAIVYIKNKIPNISGTMEQLKAEPELKNIKKFDGNLEGTEKPYELIKKTILTYYIIDNIQKITGNNAFMDEYAFYDIMNIIGTINLSHFSLFGRDNSISTTTCSNARFESIASKAIVMELCIDCEQTCIEMDTDVSKLRYAMENISIPLVMQTGSIILFVLIVYIISFIIDVLALKKSISRQANMNQLYPDTGIGYNNNGMMQQPGYM